MIRCLAVVCTLVAVAVSVPASARSLHWAAMEVSARLDADGRLHVTEQQAYVFSGAWNGGERTFNIRPGQQLDFHRLTRIDPSSGERREVAPGNLSHLDNYGWASGGDVLRWRSRLPADPPFDATRITYELEYTLSNILAVRGDGTYLLDHDFAFPDRPGAILRFTLDLDLDPAWLPVDKVPQHLELQNLEPGRGVVLRAALRHAGLGRPAGVAFGAPQWLRLLLVLLPIGLTAGRGLFLLARERRLGKFAPVRSPSEVTRAWVEREVLSFQPEVVGAAWDDTTSAAEVAAVLARMVQEGKLASRVENRRLFLFSHAVLHLELKADRDSLPDYEGRLVRALFFSGDTTDTDAIRDHYHGKGFDPAAKIRKPLEKRLSALAGADSPPPRRAWLPTLLLFLGALACTVSVGFSRSGELTGMLLCLGIATVLFIITSFQAYAYRTEVVSPRFRFALFQVPLLVMTAGFFWFGLFLRPNSGTLALTGICLYVLCLCNSIFNLARTRQDAARIRLRKNLAAGREFMRRELRKPSPHLEDAWYPYLLAFGLGRQVDRWFRAYGSNGAAMAGSVAKASGGWSSTTGAPAGFTGGGGMFGGGGASGSWAAAAGAMAVGVAKPGSSGGSGGGGGGGGGGSSGGGGGGGW